MKKFNINDPLFSQFDYIIAGTGGRKFNRFNDLALADKMSAELSPTLEHRSPLVVSGGAQGWDHYMAKMAYRLKIPFVLLVPNKLYGEYYWGPKQALYGSVNQFNAMCEAAQAVFYTNDSPRGENLHGPLYQRFGGANFDRNDAMVALADHFLVWDPSTRGTSHCYSAIRRANKSYRLMNK